MDGFRADWTIRSCDSGWGSRFLRDVTLKEICLVLFCPSLSLAASGSSWGGQPSSRTPSTMKLCTDSHREAMEQADYHCLNPQPRKPFFPWLLFLGILSRNWRWTSNDQQSYLGDHTSIKSFKSDCVYSFLGELPTYFRKGLNEKHGFWC